MSAINVTKMWSKSGGSFVSERFDTLSKNYAFTEGYQVLCEIGDTAYTAASAVGIPSFGNQHSSGAESYVNKVDAEPMGPILWQVLVGYDGRAEEGAISIEWSDETTTEPIDRDITGRAIVTTNYEPVEGLSMDISDQIVTINRQFFSINTYAIGAYRRSVNSDTFLGWPPGTARLVGFSAKNQFLYGAPTERWDVSARIQFRYPYVNTTAAQAWYKRWRHEGLWINSGGIIQRGRDAMGQEVTKPVLLKLDGTQETNPDNAYFFHTQVYGSLPYSGLGLL